LRALVFILGKRSNKKRAVNCSNILIDYIDVN